MLRIVDAWRFFRLKKISFSDEGDSDMKKKYKYIEINEAILLRGKIKALKIMMSRKALLS